LIHGVVDARDRAVRTVDSFIEPGWRPCADVQLAQSLTDIAAVVADVGSDAYQLLQEHSERIRFGRRRALCDRDNCLGREPGWCQTCVRGRVHQGVVLGVI
jgi:hypothetical protein